MTATMKKLGVVAVLFALVASIGLFGCSSNNESNFRAPGGNFNDSVANDLRSMVQGEIGWNIDTEDWRRPGVDTIASRIKSAGPGEVILMHDGGGDRSQTVAALREALPYLKSQGYKFVTISELIEAYPYQEGQHS